MTELSTTSNSPLVTIDRPDRKLLAVGRGEDLTRGVAAEALQLAGIMEPGRFNVLVVPTPASTQKSYDKYVSNAVDIFGNVLGGDITILHGPQQNPSREQYLDGLGNADIIWTTGGSSVNAKRSFDETGFGEALVESQGKVIAGGSAGAVLQATEAMSWYTPVGEPEKNAFVPVDGLGLIDVTLSPHLDYVETSDGLTLPRSHYFGPFLENNDVTMPGLGIDDAAAIAFADGKYRILAQDNATSEAGISMYHRNTENGLSVVRHMPSPDYLPINQLGQAHKDS